MATLCLTDRANATVIYQELFPGLSTSARNFQNSGINWQAHIGATAVDQTNNADTTSSSSAVIWTTNGQDGTPSYAFSAGATPGLFWTNEFGTLTRSSVVSISFYLNNTNTTPTARVAVRLDNNTPGNTADDTWYATDTTYTSTGGSSGNWTTNGQQKTFLFTDAAASWRDMTFVPGTSLSVSGTARTSDLPVGDINGTGIFFSGSGFRLDTFQVSDTPEPSSAFIVAAAGLLALQRRRRRAVPR
jgi:hypothetical protein